MIDFGDYRDELSGTGLAIDAQFRKIKKGEIGYRSTEEFLADTDRVHEPADQHTRILEAWEDPYRGKSFRDKRDHNVKKVAYTIESGLQNRILVFEDEARYHEKNLAQYFDQIDSDLSVGEKVLIARTQKASHAKDEVDVDLNEVEEQLKKSVVKEQLIANNELDIRPSDFTNPVIFKQPEAKVDISQSQNASPAKVEQSQIQKNSDPVFDLLKNMKNQPVQCPVNVDLKIPEKTVFNVLNMSFENLGEKIIDFIFSDENKAELEKTMKLSITNYIRQYYDLPEIKIEPEYKIDEKIEEKEEVEANTGSGEITIEEK